jgi:chromosome partitioning protein
MIISSISYKGGVGKSTISQNLAVCLKHAGHQVVIVDSDESQNSSYWHEKRDDDNKAVDVVKCTNDKSIAKTISKLYNDYDYVVIDSPPSQSVIADKIILLSHIVLIPVTTKGGSEINTANQFLDQLENLSIIKKQEIPAYFVINEFNPRANMHKEFVEVLKEMGISVLDSKLHSRVAYGEANVLGLGVYEHSDPKAKAEMVKLVNEISKILKTL